MFIEYVELIEREEFDDGMFPMTLGFSRPKHSGEQGSHLQGGWLWSQSRDQRRRELHHARWKNSYPLDSDRSDWLPQVHLGVGCVEFRCALLGSGFLRWATLLELVESRRDQIHQELLPSTTTDGLHRCEAIGKDCCSSSSSSSSRNVQMYSISWCWPVGMINIWRDRSSRRSSRT